MGEESATCVAGGKIVLKVVWRGNRAASFFFFCLKGKGDMGVAVGEGIATGVAKYRTNKYCGGR